MMKTFAIAASMVLLVAGRVSGSSEVDLSIAIKAIALTHTNSRRVTADGAIYTLYAYRSPRGYRTIIRLIEPTHGIRVLAMTIYESVDSEQRGTLLLDEGADGVLDATVRARDTTLSGVRRLLQLNLQLTPSPDEQRIYNILTSDVRSSAAAFVEPSD